MLAQGWSLLLVAPQEQGPVQVALLMVGRVPAPAANPAVHPLLLLPVGQRHLRLHHHLLAVWLVVVVMVLCCHYLLQLLLWQVRDCCHYLPLLLRCHCPPMAHLHLHQCLPCLRLWAAAWVRLLPVQRQGQQKLVVEAPVAALL